ncbi:MAG: TolC family protein [Bacteroidetes bacterium]|nr:TolC family protein [Bacteroidota bacterium]
MSRIPAFLFRSRFNMHIAVFALSMAFLLPSAYSQEVISLQQALELGLKNNYSIILQQNNEQISKNSNTLGNAGFLPSLSLNAGLNNTISTTHQEQFTGTVKDVSNGKSNALNAGIQLNWTLFDGLNMFVSRKMLGVLEDLGENGTRIVVEGTVSDISLTYYGIIQLKNLVKVAQDAVDLSMQRKRIASAKVSLGAGSQLMLLQATVDLNADSTRLIRQLVTLVNTRADFNRLLSRDPKTPFEINDSIQLTIPGPYDSLLNKALKQNTALTAARMNQDLTRLGVRQAQSDRYPQLNLTAGYVYTTLNSQSGFLQYNQSYGPSYGLNLTYNLFNGFNVNRAIKNAKVLMNSGETEVQDVTLALRTSLYKTHQEFNANLAIVKMQLANVAVANENVTIAFEKYKLGSINDIELREIQKKLIDAEYELISSQFEAKKAEVELARLSGELLR